MQSRISQRDLTNSLFLVSGSVSCQVKSALFFVCFWLVFSSISSCGGAECVY